MALCHVAVRADGLQQEVVARLAIRYGVTGEFTSEERAFLDDPHPPAEACRRHAAEHGAYATLLWALGFLPELPRADGSHDPAAAVKVLRDFGPEGFLRLASLRPESELREAADGVARLLAETPDGLDRPFLARQHTSLAWLLTGAPWE